MTSRSARGRWQRVLEARRVAREALGHDPVGGDVYGPPKRKPPTPAVSITPIVASLDHSGAIGLLSLGEVAQRLGISRDGLDAMIAAGTIKALPTGFTRMIPTSEVERVAAQLAD